MIKLSTPVNIAPPAWHIEYADKLLMLGSCFADNVAAKMAEYYFQVTANPFGTLYNPLSIARAWCLNKMPELVEWNGLWHSMYHHGDFSAHDQSIAYARCQASVAALQQAIREADTVIITFGTAWVYEQNGAVVANCHKMPASWFTRRRLTVEEIVAEWQPIVAAYPDKHFIFTVSPIRHLKDGLHQNQLSKATLLLAAEQLAQEPRCAYFPSYEILLDELRDYRFFADDMIHPTPLAINYIWERFVQTYMTSDTRSEMNTLHQLYLNRHHTILHPDSPESGRFLRQVQQDTAALAVKYPWIAE